jgi:hypothetical protein
MVFAKNVELRTKVVGGVNLYNQYLRFRFHKLLTSPSEPKPYYCILSLEIRRITLQASAVNIAGLAFVSDKIHPPQLLLRRYVRPVTVR